MDSFGICFGPKNLALENEKGDRLRTFEEARLHSYTRKGVLFRIQEYR